MTKLNDTQLAIARALTAKAPLGVEKHHQRCREALSVEAWVEVKMGFFQYIQQHGEPTEADLLAVFDTFTAKEKALALSVYAKPEYRDYVVAHEWFLAAEEGDGFERVVASAAEGALSSGDPVHGLAPPSARVGFRNCKLGRDDR
jgi:hypothetical protein